MRTYFDSSVLVAATVEEENHHPASSKALADISEGATSAHALAETFATLTSGRLDIQLSPNEAWEIIEANVCRRLQVLPLSFLDYQDAIRRSHGAGARGGAIFDMLHLQAARRWKAQRILTLNVRHFHAFASDLASMIAPP